MLAPPAVSNVLVMLDGMSDQNGGTRIVRVVIMGAGIRTIDLMQILRPLRLRGHTDAQ